MAEMRPRLLQDFLIPHLDSATFKDKLCWVNRSKGIFRIFWRHQSSSRFSPEDSSVFQQWAMMKNLWEPSDPKCLTKAKQRLRAALLKLKSVKCINKEGESRIYQIISVADAKDSDEDSTTNNDDLAQSPLEYAYPRLHFGDDLYGSHLESDLQGPHFEDDLQGPCFEDDLQGEDFDDSLERLLFEDSVQKPLKDGLQKPQCVDNYQRPQFDAFYHHFEEEDLQSDEVIEWIIRTPKSVLQEKPSNSFLNINHSCTYINHSCA